MENRGPADMLNQNLSTGLYKFSQSKVTMKKGDVYGTYPVYVKSTIVHEMAE